MGEEIIESASKIKTTEASCGHEVKKLAPIRIWQVVREYTDYNHKLSQKEIVDLLEKKYDLVLERKAVARNITLLQDAGIDIKVSREGIYLNEREFDDSELHLLIDSVLSSKHITAKYSKDLIERLCSLSSKYFRNHVKHIQSVNEWSKTDNPALFFNIEMIDCAIETNRQIHYDYNKYGADKKLHKSSEQYVTPYIMLLHNQHYYLMAYSEYWGNMVFHRLDHITNIQIYFKDAVPISSVPGYERGINYKELSTAMPYMYTDKPVTIEFAADVGILDQIIDWFGKDIHIVKNFEEGKVNVRLKASPKAMEHWATQYINYVEIKSPPELRAKVKEALENGIKKYQ